MHPRKLRFAAPRTLLVTGSTTALVFASAGAASAGTLDTSATLQASSSTPSVVSIGDNGFSISVWAAGNVPSTQTGLATVTTKYFMAADGTITPSTAPSDQHTLQFTPGYQYNGCPTSNAPQGCPSNPFVVTADLVVAAGTPGGTAGTVTIGTAGTQGLSSDSTPATGYVRVADSNHAPTMPGAPALGSSSTSPNNTGDFTIEWTPATDQDAGDTVTYTVQKRDADDADWTPVDSGLTANSYTFTGEPEGTWRYRVQAVDSHGATSAFAEDGSPIVVIDKSAPNPPTASTDASIAYTDGDGANWYKDSVTVSFASAGDPALADGSAGSGVASVTAAETYNATGSFVARGSATDNAGNRSNDTTLSGSVDATAPTVHAGCPASVVLNDAAAVATWTASDEGSGLATDASGSIPLDTSTVGNHTVTIPGGTAVDNVGHLNEATECSYHVGYAFHGFLQPINDTAHQIGLSTSVFKAGSTIPVKFQLFDANGAPVQAATAPIWLNPAKGGPLPSTIGVDESTYTDPATSGSFFKWDASSQQYIFNYKTDKSQTGYYWRIGVKLDDGSTQFVTVALK